MKRGLDGCDRYSAIDDNSQSYVEQQWLRIMIQ